MKKITEEMEKKCLVYEKFTNKIFADATKDYLGMTAEQFLKNFNLESARLPNLVLKLVGLEPDKSRYYIFSKGSSDKYALYCFFIKDENTSKKIFEEFPATDYALKHLPETDTENYKQFILTAGEVVMEKLLDGFRLFIVTPRIKATRKL